ncbi:MAG: helix-turn-helix transcriptional regulator [Clostridiales bacterium]|nr:helix-turn-helix transcriptional regulator [Clostridiales bacterium]
MNISSISASYSYIYGDSRMPILPHHFVGRCYPFIVMVYVETGVYYARIGNAVHEVRAGEALVVPEFLPHDVYMSEPGVLNWAHIRAHLFGRDILSFFHLPLIYREDDAALLGETARELAELSGLKQSAEMLPGGAVLATSKPEKSEADVFSKADIAPMLNTDMLLSFQLKTTYDEMVARMLRVILRRAKNAAMLSESDSRWISDVSRYIQDRICMQISLNQLATAFQMSVRKFSTRFRQLFPQSPIDYVLSEKIKYSTWLLLNGRNVKAIALDLSFTDSYYFSRQFKKRMGCSPTQYRLRYQKEHSKG